MNILKKYEFLQTPIWPLSQKVFVKDNEIARTTTKDLKIIMMKIVTFSLSNPLLNIVSTNYSITYSYPCKSSHIVNNKRFLIFVEFNVNESQYEIL